MKKPTPDRLAGSKVAGGGVAPGNTPPVTLELLYTRSKGSRWGLSRERFSAALERSAEKRRSTGSLPPERVEEYLASLHLEDLALASACIENCEPAWEHFVTAYRPYLRAA